MAAGDPESSRCAIVAGAGRFPFHVAQAMKRQGHRVIVLGIRGWADPALAGQAATYEEVAIGELAALIQRLKAHRVDQVILAGKVTKAVLLGAGRGFDAEARRLLERAGGVSVNGLLTAMAERLSRERITMLDSSTFLSDSLCPEGPLTARAPSEAEALDVRVGVSAARQLAALDIGQTVVVKDRVVVAAEALEGTDAAIRRAHQLAGSGLVVAKVAAPQQDRRFDLPVIGPETVTTLREAGVTCLAVDAGMTLVLERDAVSSAADGADISIVGMPRPPE